MLVQFIKSWEYIRYAVATVGPGAQHPHQCDGDACIVLARGLAHVNVAQHCHVLCHVHTKNNSLSCQMKVALKRFEDAGKLVSCQFPTTIKK